MKKRRLLIAMFLLGVAVTVGCAAKFDETNGDLLCQRWDDSGANSAVAWWYCGDEEGFRYFAEVWPDRMTGYKVRQDEVDVVGFDGFTFTSDREKWINLKKGNLCVSVVDQGK